MFLLAQETVTIIPPWMQGSVGLMAALMILRAVFSFIDRRELKKNGNGGVAPAWAREPIKVLRDVAEDAAAARPKLKDLHVWHSPEEGVQEWKNKHLTEQMTEFKLSLEACSARSSAAIDNNTRAMERLLPILMDLEK